MQCEKDKVPTNQNKNAVGKKSPHQMKKLEQTIKGEIKPLQSSAVPPVVYYLAAGLGPCALPTHMRLKGHALRCVRATTTTKNRLWHSTGEFLPFYLCRSCGGS